MATEQEGPIVHEGDDNIGIKSSDDVAPDKTDTSEAKGTSATQADYDAAAKPKMTSTAQSKNADTSKSKTASTARRTNTSKSKAASTSKRGPKKTSHEKHYRISDLRTFTPAKRHRFLRWFCGSILIGLALLTIMCTILHNDGEAERGTWWESNEDTYTVDLGHADEVAADNDAVHVSVGTYLETIKNISIKNSTFEESMLVWFRWDGSPDLDMANHFQVYKGAINKKEILSQSTVGDTHYQLVRIDTTVNKVFYTSRFPLDSHQLRTYIESNYDATQVAFDGDIDNSGINDGAMISGYDITNHQCDITAHQYKTTESDPTLSEPPTDYEYMTAATLERSGIGTYFKCFIAMYGTTLWVLIMLYIASHHRVDPLGMIPGALFGTVSNIMVGAALLPDALDMGLLEFVNIWGILTIVVVAIYIIQINNIRSEYGRNDEAGARFFGRGMFYLATGFALIGNIALPLSAIID
ncbi:MAG: hypothetical protein LKF61_03160 [Eggerthellaceae bacterium]|jgi:hypothetical protein|nr:hypothetical protein [Eggerthellaceae bacterium]MCH4221081.1 hypothetical protein [Eggerthellaceae bacterium]